MRNIVLFVFCFSYVVNGNAQNCNAFLYSGDTLQYEACVIAKEANGYYQFSKEFQEAYDRAIEKYEYYAPAYRAKSVSYLKSGDFVTWKKLMDKAVSLDPKEYLSYRGACRFQFFKDYKGAITDIEKLDSLINYDMGHSANGMYHLNIIKTLCYKALGENKKAINIIEQQLADKEHWLGLLDNLHLGVLYLEEGNLEKAKKALKLQEAENNLADVQFYLAMIYKRKGEREEAKDALLKAKKLHRDGLILSDPYVVPKDKIYLKQIEQELASMNG